MEKRREVFEELSAVELPSINSEDNAKGEVVVSTKEQYDHSSGEDIRIIVISQRLTTKFSGRDKQMYLKGSIPTDIDGLKALYDAIGEAITDYEQNF